MPGLGLSSRAIIGLFYSTLEGEFDASWVKRVGALFKSDQESETYKWLGNTPEVREWTGPRLAKQLRSSGISVANKTFESTLEVDVDDLRRDKTGQIRVRIQELADRVADHWNKLVSTLITNGEAATSGLAYDGEYFFDTDHRYVDAGDAGGAQKNLLTASEVPALNVGTATAPTEAEMAGAILGVISYMLGYLDDRGEPMNGNAREFIVMSGVNLWGPAHAACTSRNLIAGSGAVADNKLINTGLKVSAVCNPRLDWTDKFTVLRADGRMKPFILQEELAPEMTAIADGSEEEFKNNRHLYGVKAIRNAAYGQWQHAAKATLS